MTETGISKISCDEIMTESDVAEKESVTETYLQSFPAGIVQKVITFFFQLYNSHLIDIFVIAIGAAKKMIYGG